MLKLASLALLLLVAGAATASRPVSSDELDTISLYIKATLENLREAMPHGIPELSIPPLEPLSLPVIDIPRIREGPADVKLDMRDFILRSLSSFVVRNVRAHTGSMTIELELFFPQVAARANYDLDGKILIFPLYGNGPAAVQVNDLNIHVTAAVSIEDMRKVQLNNLQVDLTFSQIQMYLENILGGGNLGDVVNTLINSLGKLIYDKLKGNLLPEVNRILRTAVNNELAKVDLQDIIGGIMPYGHVAPVDDSANIYVDRLMGLLRPHIIENNLDPVPIPDQTASFSKKVLGITWKGSARLHSGRAHGLSTIHRAGHFSVHAEGTTMTVSGVIGINSMHGGFNARAEFMGIAVNAKISFGVARVRVSMGMSVDISENGKARLNHFSISEVSAVNVSVTGLGPLNWILTPIANVVVNSVKRQIVSAIESPIRNELTKLLEGVTIPFP